MTAKFGHQDLHDNRAVICRACGGLRFYDRLASKPPYGVERACTVCDTPVRELAQKAG